MAAHVPNVYIGVVDDVVGKVRDEFVNSGSGEAVLNELQALWEFKMLQRGAIWGNIERTSVQKMVAGGLITPVHDLNVPYEGPLVEYVTPTAELLFPPTPLQTPMQTPLPGNGYQGMYNMPTGPSDYAPSPISDVQNGLDMRTGRHSPFMQPPSPWMNNHPLDVDVNVAYQEGRDDADRGASHQSLAQDFLMMSSGKRKRDDNAPHLTSGGDMPQQDGSGDVTIEFLLPKASQLKNLSTKHHQGAGMTETISNKEARGGLLLPQRDGIPDEYEEMFPFQGVASEDHNTPADHGDHRAPTPFVGTPKPSKGEAADDDEPPLNEDDDDDLDDLEEGEEETRTQHLVLAQFDKVSRTKSRWRCTLKGGIMHLNNRDVLFNKASGEFDF